MAFGMGAQGGARRAAQGRFFVLFCWFLCALGYLTASFYHTLYNLLSLAKSYMYMFGITVPYHALANHNLLLVILHRITVTHMCTFLCSRLLRP
ncbi:hypothetical protein B0T20DRAFT_242071 [Sordaria brevicollis]|uniref:Uncharacterized protein n=1 Tax=Sordaria brevicollis TaxID=83679 RepID=A0AAE0PBA4_SORBR|nr:hypothetical protein B0T20DRAFT_242071 [Sordaria brevicollis]